MKKLFILLICFNLGIGQTKSLFSESITGSYNTIKAGNQILLSLNSQNHINFKTTYMDVNPVYTYSNTGGILNSNEFVTKEDFGYKINTCSLFVVNQFNSSLIRKIDWDVWNGIGFSKRFNLSPKLYAAISYAILDELRKYNDSDLELITRNSVRLKIVGNYSDLAFNIEYYYQPNMSFTDTNIYGASTLTFLPNKPISFIIQNVYNFIGTDKVKTIQNTSIGIKINIIKINDKTRNN